MDAAEHRHVALGLIFLKYISDVFEERHAALLKEKNAKVRLCDSDDVVSRKLAACTIQPSRLVGLAIAFGMGAAGLGNAQEHVVSG